MKDFQYFNRSKNLAHNVIYFSIYLILINDIHCRKLIKYRHNNVS